jgi:hypothetical protein
MISIEREIVWRKTTHPRQEPVFCEIEIGEGEPCVKIDPFPDAP